MSRNKSGFLFTSKTTFFSPTSGRLVMEEMGKEIMSFITSTKGEYQLIIGSDSHFYNHRQKPWLELVSAVIIHRIGHGGRYFWTKKRLPRFYSLKEKIYQETLASIELADKFIPYLKDHLNGDYEQLQIHIDVGAKGPTREMIKEVVGMVVGNGFTPKTKPDAYAASVVADRYT